MAEQKWNWLAISGSLREHSTNTAVLDTMIMQCPESVNIQIYDGIDALPHFNPDRDSESVDSSVVDLRENLKNADGVIICTPEYAGGMPGVLKNMLDWVVSSGELYQKPVAAISASPMATGGQMALQSLLTTLSMLDSHVEEKALLSIPFIGKKLSERRELTDTETIIALKRVMASLLDQMKS